MRGSVIKRGSTYTAYWSTKDSLGKRKQHTRGGFREQSSAWAFLEEVIPKVKAQEWRPGINPSIADFLSGVWYPSKVNAGLAGNGLTQYRNTIEYWINPYIGHMKMSQLTPAMMDDFCHVLRTTETVTGRNGLSPRSIEIAVVVMKSAAALAQEREMGINRIARYRAPKQTRRALNVWTEEEAARFLQSTTDDSDHLIWMLALCRGMRRSEILGLEWRYVDLARGTFRIEKTHVVIDNRVHSVQPKNESSRRTLHMDDHLSRAFGLAKSYAQGPYVFHSNGIPPHPNSVSQRWIKKVRELDLPKLHFHGARHTCATILLGQGVPVKVVQEMLGHASAQMTIDLYGHFIPGMADEAGANLSNSLLGTVA